MSTQYLLRPLCEQDFDAMVRYLKYHGYKWVYNDPTYEYMMKTYFSDKRKNMLLHGSIGVAGNKEITATYLSQFNRLNDTNWTMDNVQTIIPLEFYEKKEGK